MTARLTILLVITLALVALCLSAQAGVLTPTAGKGLILLGGNSFGTENNGAWVFDPDGTFKGVVASSAKGHGLAYGDADGDGMAELYVGSQEAANESARGAFKWDVDASGNVTFGGSAITFQNGNGVAIGQAGTDTLYIGSQFAASDTARGAFKYDATSTFTGSLFTGFTGGGVAYGTNIRGNGKAGVVIGSQGHGTTGAFYYEYDQTAGWQYQGDMVTFSNSGAGTAVGDTDGDGIPNVLVAGGSSVFDFQYNASTGAFDFRGSAFCGDVVIVKAIAFGSVTGVGTREVLAEVNKGGYLEGFLFGNTGVGAYNLLGSYATFQSADGSTGAAIINAVPEPGSLLALCSGLVTLAGFVSRRRK